MIFSKNDEFKLKTKILKFLGIQPNHWVSPVVSQKNSNHKTLDFELRTYFWVEYLIFQWWRIEWQVLIVAKKLFSKYFIIFIVFPTKFQKTESQGEMISVTSNNILFNVMNERSGRPLLIKRRVIRLKLFISLFRTFCLSGLTTV